MTIQKWKYFFNSRLWVFLFFLLFLLEKTTIKIRIATFAKLVCLKYRAMETTQWAVCEMGPHITEKHWNQRDKKTLWVFIPGT